MTKIKYVPLELKLTKTINKEKIIENSKKINGNILILYSIQYKIIAKKIYSILKNKKKILGLKQILGCSKLKPLNIDSIILLSDGKFHAKAIAYETGKKVYIFDKNDFFCVNGFDIDEVKKNKKTAYVNYLNSDNIGIIISTKFGQNRIKKVLKFLKIVHKNKNYYLFIGDNINASEIENFPQIKSWINSACPRIDMDNPKIINLNEILKEKIKNN